MKPAAQRSSLQLLAAIWSRLSDRRRRQLRLSVLVMLAGAASEMVSLGALMPFLAVLAEPQRIFYSQKGQILVGLLGLVQPKQIVAPICLFFALAALLAGALRLLALRTTVRLANSVGADLSNELFRRVLAQPYRVHLQRNSSELIALITQEVRLVTGLLQSVLQALSAFLITLAIVATLLALKPVITLMVALVLGGSYGLIVIKTRRELMVMAPRMKANRTAMVRKLQEGLGAIRDVLLDGSQYQVQAGFARTVDEFRRDSARVTVISMAPRYLLEALGLAGISFVALFLTASGTGFLGVLPFLGALALGSQRLLPLLQQLFALWASVKNTKPALAVTVDYLEQNQEVQLPQGVKALPLLQKVELRDVWFRYRDGLPWVLKGLNLTINSGESIGIVGTTGCGKSTLLDILMGLLEPDVGAVFVDGEPLEAERLQRWRRAVAHVPQDIFLLDCSIRDNITLGHQSPDPQRLTKVLAWAQLERMLDDLPGGLETRVGERGVQLSGGQRQRIGIARAMYRDCSLLVLDEATSALDGSTEEAVVEAIHNANPNLTMVMVAHRQSSLKRVDHLIRLDQLFQQCSSR